MLHNQIGLKNSGLGLNFWHCWVSFFSNFYVLWELLYIITMVVGLQVHLVKYSFYYLVIDLGPFLELESVFSFWIFMLDMFYCFVKQHQTSRGLTIRIKESAVFYLKSYFIIDVLSNIPLVLEIILADQKQQQTKMLFEALKEYDTLENSALKLDAEM